ncbi:MAG TPA: PspA/IM30 family protein [Bacteroidota bacterium]|nr:PspA/IM30 family protein [Candidatus Kapabacteria bacterium]HRS01700.1 PspA/IM30 family protein [Bacteroidota bacterium]HRT67537.1 PspA/IM30 family protein [Bacteroidota bacterium]
MGIFSRISDIFKANINDMLDKAEDPEKMINQMVLEMEESVNKTTLAVANAIANEVSIQKKLDQARKEQDDWEKKAMQALQANREDLARQALERKNIAAKNIADLQPIYEQARATTTNLRQQLDQLKAKLDEARMRQTTLIARSQAAKAQKQIAQSMSGVGSDAFSKFDKFEGKVEKLEAQATAYQQLANEQTSLEEEFKKLSSSSDVDSELLALKEKMGLLPGSDKDEKK